VKEIEKTNFCKHEAIKTRARRRLRCGGPGKGKNPYTRIAMKRTLRGSKHKKAAEHEKERRTQKVYKGSMQRTRTEHPPQLVQRCVRGDFWARRMPGRKKKEQVENRPLGKQGGTGAEVGRPALRRSTRQAKEPSGINGGEGGKSGGGGYH